MTAKLFSGRVWGELSRAAKSHRGRAWVAVPYFGKSGNRLLPLSKGDVLVVDASEAAVKSGETAPRALRALQSKGVVLYSEPNLHAKIYVFGGVAFVGSANVSARSKKKLLEAIVRTTEKNAVEDARDFVRSLCYSRLVPSELARLQKLYREPRIVGGKRSAKRPRRGPRLWLAKLSEDELPGEVEAARAEGERVAKRRRERQRSVLDNFWWSGGSPHRVGDTIIQVFTDASNKTVVIAPGKVIHRSGWRRGRRRKTFIYLELRNDAEMSLERLAKRLGPGALKRLRRQGAVRSGEFRDKLVSYWASQR